MTIQVDAKRLGAVFRAVELDAIDVVCDAVRASAVAGERIVRSVVPVDQGELRRETHTETRPGRSGVIAEIVEDTPYAAAQEVGTRPFTPPLRVLQAWAYRQAPNLGLDRSDPRQIWAFARAVQKTIAKVGIRAKFHTRDRALPKLRALLGAHLKAAIRRPRAA